MAASSDEVPFILDTAGRLWPFVQSRRLTSLFRLSVDLERPVILPALERAIDDVRRLLPGFFVRLRRGVFWSYIERSRELPIYPEQSSPCVNWTASDRSRGLIRIKPWRNRIAVEFSHALTDGGGARVFLTALVSRYLVQAGLVPDETTASPRTAPEDWENAFRRYGRPELPSPAAVGSAYHPHTTLLPRGAYRVLTGLVRSEQLKTAARGMDLKVGEFLVAVLIEAFQVLAMEDSAIPPGAVADTVAKSHTPTATPGGRVRRDRRIRRIRRGTIRILVPVDLRRFFPSPTLRNFFGFVAPEIDLRLGEYSEDEIAGEVRYQMRGNLTARRLLSHFSHHVGIEDTPLLRILPAGLKRAVMTVFFPWVGDSRYSASLSNLGPLTFGEAADSQVRAAAFIPPPSPWTRTNCSVLSFGEQTVISFGSTAAERDVEREFFRIIRRRTGWCHVTGGNP
jgi:hypothetical protein